MCLSTVYRNSLEDEGNAIMSNVSKIEVNDNIVVVTDLFERTLEIEGTLKYLDLVGAKAVIATA